MCAGVERTLTEFGEAGHRRGCVRVAIGKGMSDVEICQAIDNQQFRERLHVRSTYL